MKKISEMGKQMKQIVFALSIIGVSSVGFAQTSSIYKNDGVVNVPPQVAPQVDATNFVNNGLFNINYTGAGFFQFGNPHLFDTANTLNFTNRGGMSSSTGFRFDYLQTSLNQSGTNKMAANFVNNGTIIAGASTNAYTSNFFNGAAVYSRIFVWATNIVNPGLLEVGNTGLLGLTGKNVNLNRGTVRVEANSGIQDKFWAVGQRGESGGSFDVPIASSPLVSVQSPIGTNNITQIIQTTNAIAYQNTFEIDESNIVYQVVFVGNTNPAVSTDVRFDNFFQAPVIQWLAINTNALGLTSTNQLYLEDLLIANDNPFLRLNGSVGIPPADVPTFIPSTYQFSDLFFGFDALATTNTDFDPTPFVLDKTNYTWTAYSVGLEPTTASVYTNLLHSSITNIPGRIEITAEEVLDLTRVRIDGANYLKLSSTNHFVGSTNAQISVPNADISLGTTNGSMVISNLLQPSIQKLVGNIDVWSGRWTNVVDGVTNYIVATIVQSDLAPLAPTLIQDLKLRSTNLFISDVLNISRSVLFEETERLTLSTNVAGAPTAAGILNLLSSNLTWTASLPRLQFLTNSGEINSSNTIYFAGTRRTPYYETTFDEAYQAFVNHGRVVAAGSTVWANYFENTGHAGLTNSGFFGSALGPIDLSAGTAVLANGGFKADFSDITLAAANLSISNHALQAFRKLTLLVTNAITDGGVVATNTWQVGDGIDLIVKPGTGDLLGTTITNLISQPFAEVVNTWAGDDRGCSTAGFVNNVAIGHMILDGQGFDCLFTFRGVGGQNAIYIDQLELRGGAATNRIGPDFAALNIESNMRVYFGSAIDDTGADISGTLNGANGGRLCWVQGVANAFSGTNIVYPSGKSYTVNRGVALSTTLDSDGDGIMNRFDTTPFLTPENVNITVKVKKQPTPSTEVSWQSPANSVNYLYSATNIFNPNWVLVTNFVKGAVGGRVTITDPVPPGAPRYYRARVDVP